jgi:ElaB/YqjD/DUF883 family membrane-anchored ribosome-binding protein
VEAHVTKAGEAIGEGVHGASPATGDAAGHAQKLVQDAAAAVTAAAGQAETVLGDAGDAAQQAWSQASTVAEDVVDAGRRATRSVSRQIHENPLMSILVGCALGYVVGWWIHGAGGGGPRTPAGVKAHVKRGKGKGRDSGTR